MIKKVIISACLLISFVSFAQQGTASPYSFYGIGDTRFKGTQEFRSMAGVAVEQDSIDVLIKNQKNKAEIYQGRMERFLCKHILPEYVINNDNIINPKKSNYGGFSFL